MTEQVKTPEDGTITFGYRDGTEERTTISPSYIENRGRNYDITMKDRYGGSAWPNKLLNTGVARREDVIDFVVLTYEGETISGIVTDCGPATLQMYEDVR